MRLRSRLTILALCLLAAQSAVALLPQAASAEWTEAKCDTGPGAIFPQQVNWYEVGMPFLSDSATFAYNVPYNEVPAASNFTAIANWGDGTTAPATVENGSMPGCYVVSASSHTYTSPGTDSFSYTVHDSKTGLDHTLDARQLHFWSGIPSLLGGPSSRVIRPIIGVPWSGVVGEFSVEPPALPFLYEAQIEWEAGAPLEPGTITQVNNNTWGVSGSFIYPETPYSGTISVLLSKHGAPLGKWATSSVIVEEPAPIRKVAHFRFLGQPMLAAIQSTGGMTSYEIVFRLNRRLPETSSGRIEASVKTHGATKALDSFGGHGATACYAAPANGVVGHIPRTAARYPFTLVIHGGSSLQTNGRVLLHRLGSLDRMLRLAGKELGCH